MVANSRQINSCLLEGIKATSCVKNWEARKRYTLDLRQKHVGSYGANSPYNFI